MDEVKKAYVKLHIAVVLFGFTAILGDLIDLHAIVLVWWRVLITSLSMFLFYSYIRSIGSMPRVLILKIMGIGLVVGLHWLTFYGAIKLSNASVAVICMATTALFTSIIEPIIHRRKIEKLDLIFGVAVIPCMLLIFSTLEDRMLVGFIVGIVSAFLAALFATLNKLVVDQVDSYSITFIELGSSWVFISMILLSGIFDIGLDEIMPPSIMDWVYVLILALLCTTLAFVLSLDALKHITAFASNLVINLEPLYGIILAAVLLHEHEQLDYTFYIGGLSLVAIVFSYPILKKRLARV